MADTHSTTSAPSEATQAATHAPAPTQAPATEPGVGHGAARALYAAGGGSPWAPSERFSPYLGAGAPGNGFAMQLQRAYGNRFMGSVVQAKLAVNAPDDEFEREADGAADRVMRSIAGGVLGRSSGTVQRSCSACRSGGGTCDECKKKLQLKRTPAAPAPSGPTPIAPEVEAQVNSVRGGGMPLPAHVARDMESGFGHDFSSVRVHTGGLAEQSAHSLNANAYTIGADIVFASGKFAPETSDGKRLLAHELAHVVQQGGAAPADAVVQRDDKDQTCDVAEEDYGTCDNTDDTDAGTCDAGDAAPEPKKVVTPTADNSMTFGGITLINDQDSLKEAMKPIVAKEGIEGPFYFYMDFSRNGDPRYAPDPEPGAAACPTSPQLFDDIAFKLSLAVEDLRKENRQYLVDFQANMIAVTDALLEANALQARTEAVRYGISTKVVDYIYENGTLPPEKDSMENPNPEARASGEGVTRDDAFEGPTGAGKGMQAAAGVLIERRAEIDKLKAQREREAPKLRGNYRTDEYYESEPGPNYERLGIEIDEKTKAYQTMKTGLASRYPILGQISELDGDTSTLQELASKGASNDTSLLIAQQIATTLRNIKEVRAGLPDNDPNTWRLEKIVGLTKSQHGVAKGSPEEKLIAEKVADEQPGMLGAIALLVLNIGAILLAPATGGLSLAVSAAVNTAVTISEIQEYMMQEAMAGSSLDKATALSAERPSLFWLAVSIVGTIFDIKGAASAIGAFRTLGPLAEAVKAAQTAEEAAEAAEALRIAATKAHNAKFAEEVVQSAMNSRGAEATALRQVLGATEDEAAKLAKGIEASEVEKVVDAVGEALPTKGGGKVNVTRGGDIFSCASPCTVLREKYAQIFAKDEAAAGLLKELEGNATKWADELEAAKAAGKAEDIAKAEAKLEALKKEVASLEDMLKADHPELAAAASGTPGVNLLDDAAKAEADKAAALATKEAAAEAADTGARYSKDELKAMEVPTSRPSNMSDADWTQYQEYYKARREQVLAGVEGVKPPQRPEDYFAFRSKFTRGNEFQSSVSELLSGPEKKAEMFGDMAEPVVVDNAAMVKLNPTAAEKEAYGTSMKYVDQMVVDAKSVASGNPTVRVFSNKSRDFAGMAKGGDLSTVTKWVETDAAEAIGKYTGSIEMHSLDPAVSALHGKAIQIDKITLVYDGTNLTETMKAAIKRTAKANGVEVMFETFPKAAAP